LREEVNRSGEYILSLKAVITTRGEANQSRLLVAAKDRTINPDLND
jgi:hypothetical protein